MPHSALALPEAPGGSTATTMRERLSGTSPRLIRHSSNNFRDHNAPSASSSSSPSSSWRPSLVPPYLSCRYASVDASKCAALSLVRARVTTVVGDVRIIFNSGEGFGVVLTTILGASPLGPG